MKRTIKLFLETINNCFGLFSWLLKNCLFRSFTYGKRSSRKGTPVSILANGPTLMDELSTLDNLGITDVCMLNNAAKTELFWTYKPNYYIFADPLYFNRDLIDNQNPILSAFSRVDWNIVVFVPVGAYKMTKQLFANNNKIRVRKIPGSLPSIVDNDRIRNMFFRHKMACPPVQNVVVGAIYSLIMEGYIHINLFGVGHSWLSALAVNDKNEVCLRDVHYYEKDVEMKPWYTVNGEPYKMHVILRDLAQMFDSYHQLRCFADCLGDVTITNYTDESYIDAFDRK